MPLEYDFSKVLEGRLSELYKKDRKRYEIVLKKIEEIASRDESTIEFYKNLRQGMSGRKRVHIDKSFVLTFRFDREKRFILFLDFDHHDNIYGK